MPKSTVKKTTETKNEPKKAVKTTSAQLSVPIYSLAGTEAGSLDLPKEIFGNKVNKSLLSQAMRVYLSNQKSHWAHTKTRGEVQGSTRKIYKQKGTGRARHGAITAPIFVGGGIALGPRSRKVSLDLPKKMKRGALVSALVQKLNDKELMGLDGLDKATGKTKQMASLFAKLGKKSALVVTDKVVDSAERAVNNLQGIDLLTAAQLNAYEVLRHQSVLLTKEAVEVLSAKVTNKKGGEQEESEKKIVKK